MTRPTHRRTPRRGPDRRRRRFFARGLAVLVALALAAGLAEDAVALARSAADAAPPTREPYADRLSDQTAISACVVRVDSSPVTGQGEPSVRVNSAHFCSGVASVQRDANGDLRIHHHPGGAIGACIAKEDETLAQEAIQVGCSGGAGLTVVRFFRMGRHVRIQDINAPLANVWLLWVADPPQPP